MQSWPYHSIGKNNSPPLLFLHGFMGRGADWLPVANHCADHFYCLMPDLPGHGDHLNLPLSQPLTFDSMSEGLYLFLEQLKLDQIHLAGYSMGGRIALYAATQYPDKIKSLVLEGASPGLELEAARQERAAQDDEQAERLRTEGMAVFVEAWYKLPLFQTLQRYPQLLETVRQHRQQNDPRWVAKVISELSPGRQPSLWSKLKALPLPVLLVAGALDTKYAGLATAMAQKIPRAVTKIFPDTGHNVHLEQPVLFAKLINEFCLSR
jgi:2-succinyl-6-hydroxy-2,4-cyclohexadiene-1-carboxylate synthase